MTRYPTLLLTTLTFVIVFIAFVATVVFDGTDFAALDDALQFTCDPDAIYTTEECP